MFISIICYQDILFRVLQRLTKINLILKIKLWYGIYMVKYKGGFFMSILLLNGSPRLNGNTKKTLTLMARTILENTDNTAEIIDVAYKTVKGCAACDLCKTNGGKCIHKDDTNKIMEKLAAADTIIFGTPVYFWGMSAQLKALVDKFYSNKESLYNKKIGLIIMGAAPLDTPQYRLIKEQFECIAEYLKWEIIFVESQSVREPGAVLDRPEFVEKIKNICKNL